MVGFIKDITKETLVQQEATKLRDNFAVIQDSSKIFIGEYENGEYSFTSEAYNILGVSPTDYPKNVDIINELIIAEDKPIYQSFMNLSPENDVLEKIVRIKRPDNEIRYLNILNKAKFTEDGNLIKFIGFIQDITEEELAKMEAMRLTDNFSTIEETGKIFMAELSKGNYILSNSGYEFLGINPEDNSISQPIIKNFVLPEDMDIYDALMNVSPENSVTHGVYRVKTAKGEIKYLNTTNNAKFTDKGELIRNIGLLEDITEERLAQNVALQLQNDLSLIQSSSKIVIAHYKKGKYTFTSEIYNILEINPEDYSENVDLIKMFTIPEDQVILKEEQYLLSQENPHLHNILTIKTINGNEKVLESFMEGYFNNDGELIETVAFIQEITDKVKREEELEQLSEDRKILLQEVHHRVKNNLQLILSFLNIESRYNRDNPEYVIEQTKNRISTMALTHEEVYQSTNVSNINLEHFLTTGMNNLFNLYTSGRIGLYFSIEPLEVDIDKGIPLGLLVNEVALNTIKYAFPGQGEGKFFIDLNMVNGEIVLKIWDNGIGLPEGVSLFDSDSLGFIIIRNLTQQLEAELSLLEDVPGFGIQLVFKP